MADRRMAGRRAGALVPLFSIPSAESWGIGEIADLPVFARWLREAGLSVVQLLPVNEMGDGQTSPYSALTRDGDRPDLHLASRRCPSSSPGAASRRSTTKSWIVWRRYVRLRASITGRVRELKTRCLRDAFETFLEERMAA